LLACAVGLSPLLSGCSGLGSMTGAGPAADTQKDPLIGDQVPVGSLPPPAPAAQPAAPASPAQGPAATLTSTGSTTSPAAPATGRTGGGAPLESRDVRGGAGASRRGGSPPANARGAVPQLLRPQPVTAAGTGRPEPVPPVPANNGVVTAGNRTVGGDYGQLFARLAAHGMIWHRQESAGDGVRFTCLVANRQNPNIQHQHEATAADPVAALQAVLDPLA